MATTKKKKTAPKKSTSTKKSTTKKSSSTSKTSIKKTSTTTKTTTKQSTTKKSTPKKSTTKKSVTTKKTSTNLKSKTPIKREPKPKTKLPEYDLNPNIKKREKVEIDTITKLLKLIFVTICKVMTRFIKKVKNFTVNKYNIYKDKRLSSKIKRNEKKLKKKELKLQKKKEAYLKKAEKKEKNKKLENNINKDIINQAVESDKIIEFEYKTDNHGYPSDYELVLMKYKEKKGLGKILVFFINRFRVMRFDMKRFNKKFKYGTMKDKILIIMMFLLIIGFTCIISFCVYIAASAPEISSERLYKSNSSILLDADGNEFARLGVEQREKLSYEELPEVLIDAIVATEDSRFFQHNGIDVARFTKAVFGQLLGHSDAGGGSTITMQVSKNAATSNKSSGIEGIIRKFTDIYLSVFVFEKKFTKEQIMEFYVNIPFLGSSSYGVEQASQTYFGKSARELTLVEAATIAGLFQAPSSYDPYAYPNNCQKRRDTVLNLMERHGYITKEERDAAKSVSVKSILIGRNNTVNPNQDFVDTVVKEVIARTGSDPTTTSMKIKTTMMQNKQNVVNGIMTGETYKWKNDFAQAGIAVVSVKTGAIVAVGASRDPGELVYNYATSARRHPGSTAKPVLDYGPAIEYLNWSTGTTILDEKMTYSSGAYIKNFDNGYKGVMTAKTALAQSRNIPALQAFQATTNEQKAEFAKNLGWKPEDDGGGIILESCSIGGFEGVTPLESAAAYATFARGGTYIEPYSFTSIEYLETGDTYTVTPKKVKAMEEDTAYLINMILRYAVTSGSVGAGSVAGTDLCAKTGTSTVDSSVKKTYGIKGGIIGDSWEVAYSPDFAIATWYGYDKISKEHYLTSSEGGTARKTLTKMLTKGIIEKNAKFKKPGGVTTAEIELGTDPLELASEFTPKELRSTEYFRKGTAPSSRSTRFARLDNPSNLKYSATTNTITLTWNQAPIPDAINTEYLTEYFNNSRAYKKWTDKYVQERMKYNNQVFGGFGYEIFMTNSAGTQDLGFTTSNSFTANVIIDSNTTFTVKTSYQNFKANQSSGITVNVQANNSNITNNTQAPEVDGPLVINWRNGLRSCIQFDDSLKNVNITPSERVTVTVNGTNVTDRASVIATCYRDDRTTKIDCNQMNYTDNFVITFTAKYGSKTTNKEAVVSPSCQ